MRSIVIDLNLPDRGWFRFHCTVSANGRVAIEDPITELTADERELVGKAALAAATRLGIVKGN